MADGTESENYSATATRPMNLFENANKRISVIVDNPPRSKRSTASVSRRFFPANCSGNFIIFATRESKLFDKWDLMKKKGEELYRVPGEKF